MTAIYVSFNAVGLLKRNIILAGVISSICVLHNPAVAQQPLTQGAMLQNIPVKKVLNQQTLATSFSGLTGKITILDFFGTWCVPCLKALPHLTAIKSKFKGDVSIVLISSETEEQLQRFINKRESFAFPVIVDETAEWEKAFQPPSLPYTVVIKENKVIAITEAEKITEGVVQSWLNTTVNTTALTKQPEKKPATMSANKKSSNAAVRLSQDFLYAAKTGDSTKSYLSQLSALSYQDLVKSLKSDNEKKAFWINLYNGYTQVALQSNPEQYKARNSFFKAKNIAVAGESLSLDAIEHGILRRSKIKWSLGHLNKPFPSKKEKALRVKKLDYRIHFALNCGAKSCPPIAFYNNESLDTQLDLATKAYLTGEATYDSVKNIIYLPKLMSWFRADFGGKKGMKKILKQHGIIPADANPKIRFKDYDWTLSLNNYTNQNP